MHAADEAGGWVGEGAMKKADFYLSKVFRCGWCVHVVPVHGVLVVSYTCLSPLAHTAHAPLPHAFTRLFLQRLLCMRVSFLHRFFLYDMSFL